MIVASRKEAADTSALTYLTGTPCRHGHVAPRYARSGICTACATARGDYMKAYYQKNKSAFVKKATNWKRQNPDKSRLSNAASRKRHAETSRSSVRNRRAAARSASGSHTKADITAIMSAQRNKCAICRASVRKAHHVDHILPIKLGGSNDRNNLQILCPPCNVRKNAKHPVEYMQSLGFLI